MRKRTLLINARTSKGFTRPQLASKVGCTFEHIKRLEYGLVNPSTPLMFRICSVLNAQPEDLFIETNNK